MDARVLCSGLPRRPLAAGLVAGGLVALAWIAGAPAGEPAAAAAAPSEAAATAGATTGAAAGYADDADCRLCHTDLYDSFQEVGMARSFFRPGSRPAIEDLDGAAFYHAPSRRHYEMRRRDGRLVMRRYQVAEDGAPIHVLEQPVDWVLGSGHTTRSYLYQSEWGELFQLPVAWYTQTGTWGMAPGYDRPDHQGILRRVRRECMFCHNAYPEVPAASDDPGAPQTYPADLPEGIGCQRCHGPGAEHVDRAMLGAPEAAVRAAVVNPGRLDPARQLDVCMQCHLQPSVALSGVRRFGRGDYSFRPGEPLAGYVAPLDVVEDRPREERFEINHHAYRLLQSPCAIASGGALTCLTCHDPHRKVPAERAAAHYRAACVGCHGDVAGAHGAGVDLADCASCHMPKRRAQDVVGVVMTDHLIQSRPPPADERLGPLAERSPVVHGVEFLRPEWAGDPAEAEVYRAVAMVRGGSAGSLDRLAAALARSGESAPEPHLDLAQGLIQAGRPEEAVARLEALAAAHPDLPQAHLRLGSALAAGGRLDDARPHLLRALELEPESPEALYDLGKVALVAGDLAEAERRFRAALVLRPNMVAARSDLGAALGLQGRLGEAAEELAAALALDPRHAHASLNLGRALVGLGRTAEARRVWRHALGEVEDPRPIAAALAALDAAEAGGEGAVRTKP